jgi:TonB family protein
VECFIPNQQVKGIMRKTAKAGKQAIAALGLMLSFASAPLFAQQTQADRKAISKPAPEYPALARQMGLTGVVKVSVVIGTDGQLKDVQVLGGHPILVQQVEDTLKKWKYAPASAETKLQLEFKFGK